MECPKCGKLLSKKIKTEEADGGLVVVLDCQKCNHEFEAFINQFDLEERYDVTDE